MNDTRPRRPRGRRSGRYTAAAALVVLVAALLAPLGNAAGASPQPVPIEEAAPAGEAGTTTLARAVQNDSLTELEKLQAAILRVTNRRRERHDLPPLKASPCAITFAERHSTWMASERELAHSKLGRLLEKCSVRGVAENIAAHWGSTMEARSVVQAWMDSRTHRANILDPDLTHLGVGVAYDEVKGTWYATQDFLRAG